MYKQYNHSYGESKDGKLWTKAEEYKLRQEFKDEMEISEIAAAHHRSTTAIRYRLEKLGLL